MFVGVPILLNSHVRVPELPYSCEFTGMSGILWREGGFSGSYWVVDEVPASLEVLDPSVLYEFVDRVRDWVRVLHGPPERLGEFSVRDLRFPVGSGLDVEQSVNPH